MPAINSRTPLPLIYPSHFTNSFVNWPKVENKKPNAIKKTEKNRHWLMPNGWFVLTKRFSSKEERRRIVAAINDPNLVSGEIIGFENHLNVFHQQKHGLDPLVARGLAVYLNSSLVDLYFRQFSGHTQVNATDLRMLRYPDLSTINRLGKYVKSTFPSQDKIDEFVERGISKMAQKKGISPIKIQKKTQEALSILEELKLPKGQRNERSALTLLALLNIKPNDKWRDSDSPLMGITPIMDFSKNYYGKAYAPNTRETFRKQTMHQFVETGIAIPTPDDPVRPINSPKWVYQIESNTLMLLKSFGSKKWKFNLKSYFKNNKSLAERYAKKRDMQMIPVVINGSEMLSLTPGTHNQLIKSIVEEFAPRFAPGAEVLYVGDTGSKMRYFNKKTFRKLGLSFNSHGKFPDVVLYLRGKNWLLLIESVTSHGPMDSKRHLELSSLFSDSTAGIVYVTAFPDRPTMAKYLSHFSWETEVWIADSPSHLIHFNGERFLGPHEVGG